MTPPNPHGSPRFAETPPDAIPRVQRETVLVEGRTFLMNRPGDSDLLLDHPAIRSFFAADEYMPYWADIWPAARMLAKVVLREPWENFPLASGDKFEVLEVGCGLGLPGLAALARGLRVVFSDYDLTALRFAADNARLNGFADFRTLPMDWRFPPDDLKVAVILASDLIYEQRNVEPLLQLIQTVLLPGGVCLMTDPDRGPSERLRERLAESGIPFTTKLVRAGEPGGLRVKGTLYRIGVG